MIIIRVPPAQPQNNSDVPLFIPYDSNTPTKPNVIIATRTNPNISSSFTIIFLLSPCKIKKIYGFVNLTFCGQVSYSNPNFYDCRYTNIVFRPIYRRNSRSAILGIILSFHCRNSNYCSLQLLQRKKRTTKGKCSKKS